MELNLKQKEAVETIQGPLLLISGPGSGKTRTLVERTVYLLVEKGVKPESIFLSTFTEKAARELLTRISERIKQSDRKININEMYIGTLHSIFLRIIDENIEYSLFKDGYRVLDEVDQHFFIYSSIKKIAEIDGYREFFRDIPGNNSWERSKKIMVWLNKINEEGKRLDNIRTENKKLLFLKEAHRVYHELLIEGNVIDFTTIQREVYRLLHKKEVIEKLEKKIEYIMIDEYQDTNSIQEKIIFLLGGKKGNICVVGDDDQGIYRFRGATIKNILQFPEKFEVGRCKLITLDINYRSHSDIIKLCNRWIKFINWRGYRYDKEIIPPDEKEFSETSGVIRIGGNSEREWKDNIYKFIKKLKTTQKLEDYSQIAFLFRSLQHPNVKILKKYLEESGIPIYSPRSKDYFERKEVKLAVASLLVCFPQTKYLVLDEVQNRGNRVFDYYKDSLNLLKKQVKLDEKFHKWLVEKRKENSREDIEIFPSLRKVFYSFLQFDTFKSFIKIGSQDVKEGRETYNLGVFTEILEKFEGITKIEDIERKDIEKVIKYFFTVYIRNLFLKKLDEYEDKDEFPRGAIPFLTFHQAKGLEFPIVFVGSLDGVPQEHEKTEEELLAEYLGIEDNFEPRERKEEFDFWRMYYTAFSRAQNLLVLTSIENRSGRNEQPSRIFRAIYESVPYANSESFELEKLRLENLKRGNIKEVFTYTGHIQLYEFCPLKYCFLKRFKFKQFKNPKTFYGIFVHKLIEKIHREAIDRGYSIENLERDIVEIGKGLEKNLRTIFSEEDYLRARAEIERYLEENSLKNIIGAELRASSVEKEYIIEGTVDLVKETEEGIELFDFKTGENRLEKLENYKGQLAIYAYLLKERFEIDKLRAKLYYIEEESPIVDIELTTSEIEKSVAKFEVIAQKILSGDFLPKEFDERCKECEFRWYCMTEEEKR